MSKMIIAIDGPAGSGKSTSAKMVAEKLGFLYLDTGAMYRTITYLSIQNNIIDNEDQIIKLAEAVNIHFMNEDGVTRIFADNKEITDQIRSFEVNSKVSEVSRIPGVRRALVKIQQQIGRDANIVAEGRDTGTVVFPEAALKIFLIADIKQRAKRRMKDFTVKGENISLEEIEENILKRDRIDSSREVSPLIKADDAFEIDTSGITIEEQVNLILEKVNETVAKKMAAVNERNK